MRIPKIVGAVGLTGCAVVLLLSACSATSAQPTPAPGPTAVVVTVGPTAITLAEVDERALQQPAASFGNMKLALALYEARRAAIDELVGNALLDLEAKARGIDRATLTEQEIVAKAAPVTDTDVAAWYQANQARVQGAALDQVRAPIKTLLTQDRTQAARREFLARLTAKTAVRVLLDPPRQTVRMAANSPSRGPADAPIEIIDFSDFQ